MKRLFLVLASLLLSSAGWTQTTCVNCPGMGALQSDVPSAAIASIDNSIISAAVDASGNPNHITTAASTAALPINGGTTSLNLYIAGKPMQLATNVTTTLTTGVNYIYALGDTSNPSSGTYRLASTDFIASLIPLSYSYVAPSCSNGANVANGVGGFFAAASASVPHYWFNMATNQMNICTASGGSFTATSYGGANAPAILIGVAYYDGTSIQAVAPMPFAASPTRITQNFGTGSDGAMQITSAGTTTKDGLFNYTGLSVITGTLTHTAGNSMGGLTLYSQNPVIVWNGTVGAAGLGRASNGAGTGTGAAGSFGGFTGAGGGGGGSGVTSAAGGSGGSRSSTDYPSNSFGGGNAGAITPTAGGNGSNTPSTFYQANPAPFWMGASGGNGGGDGTNNGGQGGAGGGYVLLRAPSISVSGTGIIKADGAVGGNSLGGNGGGGGGGGGGAVFLASFGTYGVVLGTNVTAAGGAVGTKTGTGTNGGTGGTGITANIRLQ